MASTIRCGGTQHWAGKARSPSNGKWLKRALGAAQIRDRSNSFSTRPRVPNLAIRACSMLQGSACRGCLSGPRQVPAQMLACVAVDHQGERCPAILSGPDACQIRRPTFIRCCCDRRHGLYTWAHADSPFPDLPALDLEYSLHRVLVEAQKPCDRPVAEGRLCLDHCLDGLC